MEPQKTLNCHSSPERKEQSQRYNLPRAQTTPQSYNNQNSVILAENGHDKMMEQNREPRNKPTHQWPINLQQRRQKYIIEKKNKCWESQTTTCQSMRLEHSLVPHKQTNPKWLEDLNGRHEIIKFWKRIQVNIFRHKLWIYSLALVSQGKRSKSKTKQVGFN